MTRTDATQGRGSSGPPICPECCKVWTIRGGVGTTEGVKRCDHPIHDDAEESR